MRVFFFFSVSHPPVLSQLGEDQLAQEGKTVEAAVLGVRSGAPLQAHIVVLGSGASEDGRPVAVLKGLATHLA